jgi:hypothetical protein
MTVKDFVPLIKELDKYVVYFHISSGETLTRTTPKFPKDRFGKLFRIP